MGYRDIFDINQIAWVARGKCINLPSILFFPNHTYEDGHLSGPDSYKKARVICKDCPVRSDCLRYSINHHVEYGMWGGMSPRERREFRRKG